jgi:CRP-like cAMP-binding protein
MLGTVEFPDLSLNRLLAAFPDRQGKRLTRRCQLIELTFGQILHQKGEVIHEIYFPTSGIVSVFAVEDETTLEVGMVGNEGAIGLSVLSGVPVSPYLSVTQIEGVALKMSAGDFLKEFEADKPFARAVNRYAHFLHLQISQAVLCNRLHRVEARLACLLLLLQDRLKASQFRLKQDFLAKKLGVRREAVTRAAGNLQQQKMISYVRGNLLILDRANLETVCCRCYQIITEEHRDLLLQGNE